MMYYISKKVIAEFDRNYSDWHRGGPHPDGWTRTGPIIDHNKAILTRYSYSFINVDDGLAKNRSEVERWHLNFLKGNTDLYLREYLLPRYTMEKSLERMKSFVSLFENIKKNGVRQDVWVAETPWMEFDLFRFNGCHRLSIAKTLGITHVPALIFKAEELLTTETH